jgi:hypothetical protein
MATESQRLRRVDLPKYGSRGHAPPLLAPSIRDRRAIGHVANRLPVLSASKRDA